MIRVIRAADRYFADLGWLKSHWLFSFSEYFDPLNIQFGSLRVYNDDAIAPGMGFPMHKHSDIEILTIPFAGEITHEDSLGNRATIHPGEVQRVSAGKGIEHSEFNMGSEVAKVHQLWFYPEHKGLAPSYEQRSFNPENWRNRFCPLASGQGLPDTLTFNSDASVYRADIIRGKTIEFDPGGHRRVFVYVLSGSLRLSDRPLAAGDQIRADEEQRLLFHAQVDSTIILVDVPSSKGFGYEIETLKGAHMQ